MFNKDKYKIVKNVLSSDELELTLNYLLIRRQCFDTMMQRKFISQFNTDFGTRSDTQVPGVWSCYSDPLMETILLKIKPLMEKTTKLKLNENYSYCRIYEKGSELKYHLDRESCEISATMNIGGDPWPIHFEYPETKKKLAITLKPGELIIYKGCDLYHWRNPFDGEMCIQVFLHYTDINSKYKDIRFDNRPHIGLPKYVTKNIYGN